MKTKKILMALRKSSAARLVRESPLWFMAPVLVLGGGMAAAVHSYEPLVFDASQYQTATAHADELGDAVDAAKLEKKSKPSAKKEAAAAAEASAASSASKAAQLAKATLADGSFTGFSRCTENEVFDYYLRLTIKVKGGKVVDITNVRGSGTGDAGDKSLGAYDSINDSYIAMARNGVLPQLSAAGKAGKTPGSVDTVSGATYSSSSMLEAYLDALGKSAAAAGTKVDKPKKDTAKKDDGGTGDTPATDPDEPTTPEDPAVPDTPELDYGTGQWTAYALCENTRLPSAYTPYYIGVTVSTLDGKVSAIDSIFGDAAGAVDPNTLYDEAENKYYLDRALEGFGISGKHPGVKTQLDAIIASGKTDGKVDTVSGATYSSRSILEAYRAALALAHQSTLTGSEPSTDSAGTKAPGLAGEG